MADDKGRTPQDRKLINLDGNYEIREWTTSPGVSETELRKAVAAAGASAAAVRDILGEKST